MKTYTVTVKPNRDAFAAILHFDSDAWVELESGDEAAETYTINSEYALDALLDAAPGLIEWDDVVAVLPDVPMISVTGTTGTHDERKFFFDSLTGEPLFVEVFHDFDDPTTEMLARADVPAAVAAEVDRYLAAATTAETGLYGMLLRLDRRGGQFTTATRAMWRVWNWYVVARGAQ